MRDGSLVGIFALAAAILLVSIPDCPGASSEDTLSEEVAVATEVPSVVEVTSWDISLQTDLPNNRLKIRASCAVQNKGEAPVDSLDFDLLGAEKFYGVEVDIASITRLVGGKEADAPFKRFMEQEPEDPSQARTHEYPEVTRVSLSPALKKGEECGLMFDYAITCVDITNEKLHYRLICEPESGAKETCLIADFAWFPRLSNASERSADLWKKNFFSRGSKLSWRVTLTHPAELEGVVIDGKTEKSERVGDWTVSQWGAIGEGTPQVFIGPAERVEKKGDGVTVIFLLPRGNFNREYVDAVGDLLIHAYRVFTDWFGPPDGNEVHIVAPSGISGGHGAFMGMTVEASEFHKNKSDGTTESGKFFSQMPVHELAHSWWPGSYGRGTKFLRESLAEFSTWHLAREHYGTDMFSPMLHNWIFRHGLGGKPLFNAESDEDRFAYQKGPIVLDILRQEMGDEVFFGTLKEYARRHRDTGATFVDFVAVCNDVSRRDWMPFFYQWCYGKGCPAYHLLGFESKEGKDGWDTTVRIRNDGEGIVRCPLELRMDQGCQEEVFRVQGGEEKTFVYRTPRKVTEVVIDPQKTVCQGDQKEELKIEEGEMTEGEKAGIAELRETKARIEKGETFDDASTPLHAVLSNFSAADGLWREYVTALDVFRAPSPPAQPPEGTVWPVYMRYAGGTKLADTFILVFSKGKWNWNGNMGGRHDWRTVRPLIEERAKQKGVD